MKVLKFGGTSMGSAASMKLICQVVKENIREGNKIILACSAVSGITNQLIELGNLANQSKIKEALNLFSKIKSIHVEIAKALHVEEEFKSSSKSLFIDLENIIQGVAMLNELSPRSKANLLSVGERCSTRLLVAYFKTQNIKAKQFDSDFIRTEGTDFEEDIIDWEKTIPQLKTTLEPALEHNLVPVVTGFWGRNHDDVIALLGRGGSDFTGAILAVSMDIKVLEIWTDVDGFLSADPRIVDRARIIDEIGFQEASELCFFGAKVLHPKTIRPVIEKGGEVWIKNTFSSNNLGSKISLNAKESHHPVISISSKEVQMISLDLFATPKTKSQVLQEVFELTNRKSVPIDMISFSEAQLSICVEPHQAMKADFLTNLQHICPFELKKNRSIVCIVSPKEVKGQIGVAGKIFNSIADIGVSVDMYSQNASEIAQLIVVSTDKVKRVIKNIHKNLVIG